MRKSRILAVAIAIAGVWVVMAAGVTPVWVTEELRVLGLVTLTAAAVASLLVLYFAWRAQLRHRMLAERDDEIIDLDPAA